MVFADAGCCDVKFCRAKFCVEFCRVKYCGVEFCGVKFFRDHAAGLPIVGGKIVGLIVGAVGNDGIEFAGAAVGRAVVGACGVGTVVGFIGRRHRLVTGSQVPSRTRFAPS